LNFLRVENVVKQIGESQEVVSEVNSVLKVWQCITNLRPVFDAFFFETQVNVLLLSISSGFTSNRLDKSVKAALTRLNMGMVQIQQSTTHVMYLFEHGLGKVSVSHYLLPQLPDKNDIMACMNAATDLEKNLEYMLRRFIARLVGHGTTKISTTMPS